MGLEPLVQKNPSVNPNHREATEGINYGPQSPSIGPSAPSFTSTKPAKENLISPSANVEDLAVYGQALQNLYSGKKQQLTVAQSAYFPPPEEWFKQYTQEINRQNSLLVPRPSSNQPSRIENTSLTSNTSARGNTVVPIKV